MSTTRIISSVVILLLILSVNTTTIAAEDVDSTIDPAKTESIVDTYPQMLDVSIKDGSVISSNNEIDVHTDASIETDGKKQYWKLDEYSAIEFSFSLPLGVKNIRVELNCISTENVIGKAIVRWNGKNLENDKGERETIIFSGKNFQYPLEIKSCSAKNTLKIVCQERMIGIQSACIYFDSPLPSWDFDGMTITLLNPLPNWVHSGSQVELIWKSTGVAEGGWLKVEYRTADQQNWQTVPGLEGTTYGQNIWRDNKGHFVWNDPPKTTKCEYRFTYTREENPIEKAIEAERERQAKCSAIALDLAKRKWEFLKEANGKIDKKYWKEIPDFEKKYKESQDLIIRLENQFKELEKDKLSAGSVDLKSTIDNLSKLENIYVEAINTILSSASGQDIEKSNTYADIAENFLESCDNVYKRAKLDYENDADAIELLQEFFPKEKFQMVKEMYKKVEDLIHKEQNRFTAALELAKLKWIFLQESENYIDSEYWNEKLGNKYITAQGLINIITPQFDKLSSSDDSNLRYNELNSAISNMSKLEALYVEAIGIMLSAISEQDDIEKNEKYLENINELDKRYDKTCQDVLKKYENDEDNKDLLPQIFPKDKFLFFKEMKPSIEAEIQYQKAEKIATANESEERDWDTALKFYLQAANSGHVKAMTCLGNYYKDIAKNIDEAVKWYQKAAEQGDAQAQHNLGNCYFNGDGVPQDFAEAVKWFRKAAEQGCAQAQFALGGCYFNGNGVPQDFAEAVKWFRKAAEQEYVPAQYALGKCYYNGEGVAKDYEEAVKWYRKAAEQGYTLAQNDLGVCYFNGDGVAKDKAEAVKWYRKAAEQGEASAQSALGLCYFNGEGVAQDKAEAVKWYRKAAEQGYYLAQYYLGDCYFNGDGVAQDKAEAVKWYLKAAEQGDAQAQRDLGKCYYKGEGVPKDYEEAVKWYRKAAEQEYPEAQSSLGVCYIKGNGVAQDKAEGVKWLHKAAEQGDAQAQYNLGLCYYKGEGVPKDYEEAVKWYRKAAEQGYAHAQLHLGKCYAKGEGVPEDFEEAVMWFRKAAEQEYAPAQYELGCCYFFVGATFANAEEDSFVKWHRKVAEQGDPSAQGVKWFRKAAEQGYAQAQYDLGNCYFSGFGVPKNKAEAIRWFNEAAKQGHSGAKRQLKSILK